jgi:hypothetical protein
MAKKRVMLFFGDDDDERSDPRLEVPANRSSAPYKHNGARRYCWRDCDDLGRVVSCLSGLAVIYRFYAAVYRRYCAEGRFTRKQLELIEALMIQGLSLHQFAELKRVTPQAISSRIDALANKAPEFYRFWRSLHAGRQRPRRRDPRRRRGRK